MLRLPIAHAEGNYVCDDAHSGRAPAGRPDRRFATATAMGDSLKLRIQMARGITLPESAIGTRNVLGLMPHPERACEDLLGSSDGRDIFRSLAATLAAVA